MRFSRYLRYGRRRAITTGWVIVLCSAVLGTPFGQNRGPDGSAYSKEGLIVQEFSREVKFSADGTWEQVQTAAIRVQSDAGVRQFGVLSFAFNRDNQKIEIAYVRVRKPDGTVVATPEENIQDVSSEISRIAPSYSDLREKQIPVKALGVDDVLEYKVKLIQNKPEIPGNFWYEQNFMTEGVVLEEKLEVNVPSDKYVSVVSPKLKPEIREEPGRKIYLWKTAQLKPTPEEPAKASKQEDSTPSVQVTTFKSWAEVGSWYESLQKERAAVTPEIQAKAAELTKGLSTEADKERAIYTFVSTKFRYISLSFGVGRYQPHTAEEVLANQYGDCKDKHTLFAALLKAVGIESWPALMGAGMKIDSSVPSPGQFNHLITVIPSQKGDVWLDTTPEVAPYGLLNSALRDQQALVMPDSGPARLVKTPADPPFAASQRVDVQATLKPDGTLSGHFDITIRGDLEMALRSAFHEVSPAQWRDLVQAFVANAGFAGTVSNVDADRPESLEKPFHYSYDYTRPNYSDWENHRITAPLFLFMAPPSEDAEKPTEPFTLDAPGQILYRATIKLPKEYSAELPPDAKAEAEFADYSGSYSLKADVLTVERHLVVKQGKVAVASWEAYRKFAKKVADDYGSFIQLNESSAFGNGVREEGNGEAARLILQAIDAGRRGDDNGALHYLSQAERLNPKQRELWSAYGTLYLSFNQPQKAFDALRKEIQLHGDDVRVYHVLAYAEDRYKKRDEAIETLRAGLKVAPGDVQGTTQLAGYLREEKRYAEIAAVVRPVLDQTNDHALQGLLGEALLRSGHKDEGVSALEEFVTDADAGSLNDAAYYLADTNTNLPLAKDYAEAAVSRVEEEAAKLALATPKDAELRLVDTLGAAWDTLGWVYYQTGDLAKAERYVGASWNLSQRGAPGDHLGQIYSKQGKEQLAIHTWRLALAADNSMDDAREHLRQAGVDSGPERPRLVRGAKAFVSADEELGKLRTTDIPALRKQEGSAEFFILFSPGEVNDVQFISGSDSLKEAATSALKAVHFDVSVPDSNAEKIVRRGILSCSHYTTPSCQFVMLLPAMTSSSAEPGRTRGN